ncbi:lipid IV(A) 4-amino-4-deoxy-L-arabinosyltransferase [Moellerella wisconsensis]|uniref:lipid IV(A) 4-amino-4-deoxy-L-arabinosyltransferase n=1 Tax=Moellerella wisconsensis TaxID=158849 RepID=UPI001F4E5973|nr:lipid IV(A) 4-amino-4-deoxy-L-arabinosyltransferase [Moellerella wisconsensis]UNH26964.1 lipid IV(A) 4-amino-4-deoxy-L-arabinosyltransferase [Moellerella wisconsensis]
MQQRTSEWSKWLLLLIFVILTYFLPLNGRLLWQPDELRYAEISRELILSHNWVIPQLLDIRYFEKPVMGYWINAIFQVLFGESNLSVRLGVVFSTLISGLFIYLSAMLAWNNRRLAYNAVFIYLSTFIVFTIGTYNVLDPILTAFVTMMMFCFQWGLAARSIKHKLAAYLLLGVACGGGFLTKGFLAFLLPALIMGVAAIYYRQFKQVILFSLVSLFSACLVCLPWVWLIANQQPDYWNYFFWVEHIQRFMSDNAQNKSPFWFYIPILLVGLLPWLGYFFNALYRAFKNKGINYYYLLWFILPFIFFSITKGKLLTYILPCIAPVSILIASYLESYLSQHKTTLIKLNGIINLLIGLAGATAIILSNYFTQWRVYGAEESDKILLAVGSFLFWAIVALFTFKKRFWYLAGACTLVLSLTVGYAIPQKIASNNTPQQVIEKYQHQLADKQYLMTNNVGLGTSLAWVLKRSDITMLHQKGELAYGLAYPDVNDRFYSLSQLNELLAKNDYRHVAIVIDASQKTILAALPHQPRVIREGDLMLIFYD